jgi:hypothetical protein
MNSVQDGEYLVDRGGRPGRRPDSFTKVFQDQDGLHAIVVPPQELWNERGFELGIDEVLFPDPAGNRLGGSGLDEARASIAQSQAPVLRASEPDSGSTDVRWIRRAYEWLQTIEDDVQRT